MPTFKTVLLTWITLWLTSQNAFSLGLSPWVSTDDVHSQIVSSHTQVTSGQKINILWNLQLNNGWHIYYQNPGDSGLAPVITPPIQHATASPLIFPTPHVIQVPPITNYGYEKQVVLATTFHLSHTLTTGPLTLPIRLQYLYCKDVCMPGDVTAYLPLHVKKNSISSPHFSKLFRQHQASLPQPWPTQAPIQAHWQGNTIKLSWPTTAFLPQQSGWRFIPSQEGWLHDSAPQPNTPSSIVLQLDEHATTSPTQVQGIMLTPNGQGFHVPAIPLHPTPSAPITLQPQGHLLLAMGLAFLAGLILNLMPCVLPVLALKVVSIISTHQHVLPHTLAYTAGVLTTFLSFSIIIAGLQATGHTLGWGFHLQNPTFVGILVALLIAVALYFFGLYNIGNRATRLEGLGQRQGAVGAFATGVLAVIVATPCTVPFMGGAMAYALTNTWWASMIVLGTMGLGMATPFVTLALTPSIKHAIPKPGSWMLTLKHALGWPMLGTALWLTWVYGSQTSTLAMAMLLATCLLMAIGLTCYHRWHHPILLLLIAASTLGGITMLTTHQSQNNPHTSWQPWSPQAEQTARQKGIVFVDFTADWCLTCKVVEATVLNRPHVQEFFKKYHVALLKADWTRQDPTITQALAQHGRKGVPLYVIYKPNQPAIILPQIPTFTHIQNAITKF